MVISGNAALSHIYIRSNLITDDRVKPKLAKAQGHKPLWSSDFGLGLVLFNAHSI